MVHNKITVMSDVSRENFKYLFIAMHMQLMQSLIFKAEVHKNEVVAKYHRV